MLHRTVDERRRLRTPRTRLTTGAQTVKRIQVHYSGKVQGVGFRYTTCRLAEQFEVSGQVRNLSDGRVEMIAEAEPTELDRFLSAIDEAMAGYIDNREVSDSPATKSFDGFRVAY